MKTEAANPQLVQVAAPTRLKRRSAYADAWYQLTRNRVAVASLIFLIALALVAISADQLRAAGLIEGIDDQHRGSSLAPPMTCALLQPNQRAYPPGSPEFCFIFGADQLGRDVLSRTIFGARVSLAVAAIGAIISLSLGILYGVISGYYGGRVDNLMMRILDFLYGVPSLVLVILIQTYFTSLERTPDPGFAVVFISIDRSMGGLFFLFIALGALSWIDMARLARCE
ncbi:MAG TPA: ABC transporter permease subunit, partial [Phototrophicaceae bacterium]|nr:ABC transporter permease subunit [Phototrophicaceae bacterium]